MVNNLALDAYWNLYSSMVYEKYYYDEFRRTSILYDKLFTWVSLIASSASIASWAIWNKAVPLWASIVAISQVATLLKPYLHFTEQICMSNKALPELQKTINEMGIFWDLYDRNNSSEVIIETMRVLQGQFSDITAKYIDSADFPRRKRCEKNAEIFRDDFLNSRHPKNSNVNIKIESEV